MAGHFGFMVCTGQQGTSYTLQPWEPRLANDMDSACLGAYNPNVIPARPCGCLTRATLQ